MAEHDHKQTHQELQASLQQYWQRRMDLLNALDGTQNGTDHARSLIEAMKADTLARQAGLDTPTGRQEIAAQAADAVWEISHGAPAGWDGTRDARFDENYEQYQREHGRLDGQEFDPGDPDYVGQQAEQRFYNEQDPGSQWYREDLYHGQPGPDVAQDMAGESEEARREQLYDEWEVSDAGIAAQDAEIARFERIMALDPSRDPDEALQAPMLQAEGATEAPRETPQSLLEQIERLKEQLSAVRQEQGQEREQGMGW
jgi:hypothetical protein